MNILNPYDTFTDVHASPVSYWCRDKSRHDQRDDVDTKDQPCDPDDDPFDEGKGSGGSSGGGKGGGSAGGKGGGSAGGKGGGWDDNYKIDPPDNADLGGDEDTPQW